MQCGGFKAALVASGWRVFLGDIVRLKQGLSCLSAFGSNGSFVPFQRKDAGIPLRMTKSPHNPCHSFAFVQGGSESPAFFAGGEESKPGMVFSVKIEK